MKVEIDEWHAVATWTWSAEDDACGICRFVQSRFSPQAKIDDEKKMISRL
jgi:anaphase-promoting complex subunit 11